MSEPIVFISHNCIKDGKLDEFKQLYLQGSKLIEATKFIAVLDHVQPYESIDLSGAGKFVRQRA